MRRRGQLDRSSNSIPAVGGQSQSDTIRSPRSLGRAGKSGLVASILVVLALVPLLIPGYMESVATRILIFSLFAVSLNLLWGYAGLFSLGHAAFLGVGGYAAGLLIVRYGVDNFWFGLLGGVGVATVVALVFGVIALRLTGAYFLLVTLALGELLVAMATRWPFLSTSSGSEGVFGVPRPTGLPVSLWGNSEYYWLTLVVVVLCLAVLYRFVRSPVGLALQGIRQNELRMAALGFHTWAYRYLAFVIGGAFAGVAGVLLVYHDGFVVPGTLGLATSTIVLLMVLLGGAGTFFGPVIGAALITLVELFASTFVPERWPLVVGAAYVAVVVFARGGLVPRIVPIGERIRQRVGRGS